MGTFLGKVNREQVHEISWTGLGAMAENVLKYDVGWKMENSHICMVCARLILNHQA